MQTIFVTCTDAMAKMFAPIPTTDTHRKLNFVVRFWGPFLDPFLITHCCCCSNSGPASGAPKWGPKSNQISCCRSPFSGHLGDHICTIVCFVGGDGRPTGRPFLHKSFHRGFPKIPPIILDICNFFSSRRARYFSNTES